MMEWLRRHGIDPLKVPIGGLIERHFVSRSVVLVMFDWDETSNAPRIADGPADSLWADGTPRGYWVQAVTVVQLEAAPLPFPDVVLELCEMSSSWEEGRLSSLEEGLLDEPVWGEPAPRRLQSWVAAWELQQGRIGTSGP
jgi:hypothetical protein